MQQATVMLAADGSVSVKAGGVNPVCVRLGVLSGGGGGETHQDLSKKSGAAGALGVGDVLEVDGFKRHNTEKYAGGAHCAYQLVLVHQ